MILGVSSMEVAGGIGLGTLLALLFVLAILWIALIIYLILAIFRIARATESTIRELQKLQNINRELLKQSVFQSEMLAREANSK